MFEEEIRKISGLINQYNRFLITSTYTHDGDSVGAQLALYNIINKQINNAPGKVVKIICEKTCPEKYKFLPQSDKILSIDNVSEEKFDVGFVLDGGVERTGKARGLYDSCVVKVLIDHHKFGSSETYDISVKDPAISSTAELVYQFLEHDSWKAELTKDIASQLYLGLIFDTGFFNHSNTSPQTLIAASKIIQTGIDFSKIGQLGMKDKSYNAQRLLAKVLNSLQICSKGRIVWAVITEEMMDGVGACEEDQEGIIEQLTAVKGSEAAILFKESIDENDKSKVYKISFRSKGLVDVAATARYLDSDGGGHMKAAGCSVKGALEDVTRKVLAEIEKRFK